MATATVDTPMKEVADRLQDRAADALRHVAHVSHEAKLLKTIATDAVEDGVHAARRAIKRGTQDIVDFKDEAVIRVKREPIKAVGLAFGVGVALGAIAGFIGAKARKRED